MSQGDAARRSFGPPWWAGAFAEAVRRPASEVELDRAAILLSAIGGRTPRRPADVERELARLDEVAGRCRPATFEGWHRHLFVELGLAGNGEQYHDPRNSYLPDVLDRRSGIPISLTVLAMEVGRRLGLLLWGVGMPGHFLLGHGPRLPTPSEPVPAGTAFVDCFHGGAVLDEAGCAERFAVIYQDTALFSSAYLAPVDSHAILVRMLSNLKSNFARTRDLESLTHVLRLRLVLPRPSLDEGRELVRLLDVTGRWQEAMGTLERLESAHPEAPAVLRTERKRLLARLN